MIERKNMDRSRRVNEASIRCCSLLERFAAQDPSDPNSAWKNPQDIFDQLEMARREVTEAWKKGENEEGDDFDDSRFRTLYMEMITDAFADSLETLRESEGNHLDVEVLVDCLQSGIELLSMQEKELLMSVYDDKFSEIDHSARTPHEKQRFEEGFADLGDPKDLQYR